LNSEQPTPKIIWSNGVLRFLILDCGIEKKEKMNIEHSTLNIERRMKNKADFYVCSF